MGINMIDIEHPHADPRHAQAEKLLADMNRKSMSASRTRGTLSFVLFAGAIAVGAFVAFIEFHYSH